MFGGTGHRTGRFWGGFALTGPGGETTGSATPALTETVAGATAGGGVGGSGREGVPWLTGSSRLARGPRRCQPADTSPPGASPEAPRAPGGAPPPPAPARARVAMGTETRAGGGRGQLGPAAILKSGEAVGEGCSGERLSAGSVMSVPSVPPRLSGPSGHHGVQGRRAGQYGGARACQPPARVLGGVQLRFRFLRYPGHRGAPGGRAFGLGQLRRGSCSDGSS